MTTRVLIAEDEPFARQLLTAVLHGAGFVVRCAENGNDCLRLLAVNRFPDVLLLGIEMRGTDGHTVLETLKREDKLPLLPVVLLATNAQLELVKKAVMLGASDYLVKPIDSRELVGRVSDLTFKLTLAELRAMLASAKTDDPGLFQTAGLGNQTQRGSTAWPTSLEGRSLCVVLPRDRQPIDAALLPDSRLVDEAQVFVYTRNVWRRARLRAADEIKVVHGF